MRLKNDWLPSFIGNLPCDAECNELYSYAQKQSIERLNSGIVSEATIAVQP